MRVNTLRKAPHEPLPTFVMQMPLLTVPPHLPLVEHAFPRGPASAPVRQRRGLCTFGRVPCIATVPMITIEPKKTTDTWLGKLTWYILTFFAACISEDTAVKEFDHTSKRYKNVVYDKRTDLNTASANFIYPRRRNNVLRAHEGEVGKGGGQPVGS